jgi:hypothetical protein
MTPSGLVALGVELARELRDMLGERPDFLDSSDMQSMVRALEEHVQRRLGELGVSDDDAVVVMMAAFSELSRM